MKRQRDVFAAQTEFFDFICKNSRLLTT